MDIRQWLDGCELDFWHPPFFHAPKGLGWFDKCALIRQFTCVVMSDSSVSTAASEPALAEQSKSVVDPWTGPRTGLIPQRETSQRIVARSKFFFQGGNKFFVKGVTYGPFPPRDGIFLPDRKQIREDLDRMRQVGVNTIRLYHAPPVWFLDECDEARLKAFITVPWEQHVCFLDDRHRRRDIRERIVRIVSTNQGHPAVFAYAVGNEIPAGIVRWYGSRKIENFVESLVNAARQVDSRSLYTYTNFPPTEYLLPGSVDFYCYNVYLHQQADFQRYMARLQNLACERPLMLGEFGMDTIRHTEEEQAELLRWHIQTVARMGLAGTMIFSWTDEWFTGGHLIEDWKFGLVDAQRRPKKACFEVQRLFKDTHRVQLSRYPSVSVVVCSYNGARTLEACLTSLLQMDYPDYEVILVDDGSTDETPEIARDFPKIRTIRQENLGLSVARNTGIEAARGEIIAFTDSDCMADKDWLYYLVGTLDQRQYAAVGGPNISPPAQSWAQACVAAAPGQPSHVLVGDSEAEHIPGCNMAFYKTALLSVGGFDPEYRKAGDDVDVCWRLLEQGCRIGFSPAAVVWHHRRFNPRAYFKQQAGYGEAEALLRFKHLVYFGLTGSARWHGQVYGSTHFSSLLHRPIVYHGTFGMGLFQCIYPKQASEWIQLMSSLEWNVLTLVTLLVGIRTPVAWYVPVILFACTLAVGISYGLRARVEAPYHGFWSRVMVSLLAILQPIFRGWARYFTWMSKKRVPGRVVPSSREELALAVVWDRPALVSFWSEADIGREHFLIALKRRLDRHGWKYSPDTGWTNWDYQIYGNRWWQLRLLTMTEEHGDGKRLTRVRLHSNPTMFTRLIGVAICVVSIVAFRAFHATTTPEGFERIGYWFCLVSLWLTYLVWQSSRFRKRIAQLVELVAKDCNMMPIASGRPL
jgi:glycosyltransferase involved in cell wall biosynthesis